jgi:hypothetical protein
VYSVDLKRKVIPLSPTLPLQGGGGTKAVPLVKARDICAKADLNSKACILLPPLEERETAFNLPICLPKLALAWVQVQLAGE